MVPKTWPWYATSPSIWSAKSLTSDRSSAAESAPPGTRNTCWKSSARCGRNLVNLDSLPWLTSPHRLRRFENRADDPVMGPATAEIADESESHVGLARARVAVENRFAHH